MNATLLLRLAAPLQAWGSDSKFEKRTTQREPTKSGVIGLLAAAMGRERDQPMNDLSKLRFGVRIDQPGQLLKDYHTALHTEGKPPYVTDRYYLMDAVFLVGLEGNMDFLQTLENAIKSPVFPLFLGRRSCPPEGRVTLGIREKLLEDALRNEPWQAKDWYQRRNPSHRLTLVLDSFAVGANRRRDVPLSFSQQHRQHAYRFVEDKPDAVVVERLSAGGITEHDAFEEMGGEHVFIKN